MSSYPTASARADVYTRVTSEIIAAIESGTGSWRMPWHHHGNAIARPTNVASHKRYRGINVLALWIAADAAQYSDGVWGTYRQWAAAGGQVRKGERATTVVLWKEYRAARDDKDGENEDGQRRLFARAFSVFNAAQVDGYEAPARVALEASDQTNAADSFYQALGIPLEFGAYDAHYRIAEDRIYMPELSTFRDGASYAGTLLHEAAHYAEVRIMPHRCGITRCRGLGRRGISA